MWKIEIKRFVDRLGMEDRERGDKGHSQISSLDCQVGMEVEYIENRIAGEDNKFDLVSYLLRGARGTEKWRLQ